MMAMMRISIRAHAAEGMIGRSWGSLFAYYTHDNICRWNNIENQLLGSLQVRCSREVESMMHISISLCQYRLVITSQLIQRNTIYLCIKT